ncbi:MAG: phospholipid carrier-dependent glycosyltransferase, partial [Planctomycetota bacterium]
MKTEYKKKSRSLWWVVILGGILLFFPFLGSRALWEPDEPRQALMTLEMERDGIKLFSTLREKLYPDYPPLSYWINLAFGKGLSIMGLGEPLRHPWGYQLPAMVATILSAFFLFLLGRNLYNEETALLASFIFYLTPMVFIQGQRAMLDPWLMAFITIYFWA